MTKTYKSFTIFFVIVILVLLFFLKKYNDFVNKEKIDILVSQNVELINNELSYQKKHALSLAILFSKNQNIIKYLKNDDRKNMKIELNSLLLMISNYTKFENIQIQVHTKDLEVFIRTWEDKDIGLDLSSFRKGLVKVKNTSQPFVSNELGKRFNIKAISPIIENEEFIGSIEVIVDYSVLKERLKFVGIDILPILNNKYLDIAKYHRNNEKLHDYVLIEKNYNQKLFDLIKHNQNILENKKFYYEIDEKILTLIPLQNVDGELPAFIVASFNKSNQKFNYLPEYEYSGIIIEDSSFNNDNIQNQNPITIK